MSTPPAKKHQYLLLIFLFLLLPLNIAQAEQDKAFLWKAVSGDSTVYLMGSIHFASPGFYPLRREIEEAYESSDKLVVEVDIGASDMANIQSLLLKMGSYSGNETISKHISKSTYRLLTEHLKKLGMPPELFDKYKPGMLIMTLTSMELMKLGLSPDQGIDLHFLNRARGQKEILELETLQQQLELLMNMKQGDQMLSQTLEEFESYPKLIQSLISAWKQGNTKLLEEILIDKPLRDYPGSRPVFDKMFTQRNQKMTQKIKTYLRSGQSHFVVVGAGHLVGNKGIVALLKKSGFKVQQL